jgi:hypothetical protein
VQNIFATRLFRYIDWPPGVSQNRIWNVGLWLRFQPVDATHSAREIADSQRNGYRFNLRGRARGLNSNRLYVRGDKLLTLLSKIRVGLMWQHPPNTDFWRLVFAYSHNFDLRKKPN